MNFPLPDILTRNNLPIATTYISVPEYLNQNVLIDAEKLIRFNGLTTEDGDDLMVDDLLDNYIDTSESRLRRVASRQERVETRRRAKALRRNSGI